MELWDAPISVIAFLWWPFVFYSGWVTVASIANVSSYLVKIGWDGFGISASDMDYYNDNNRNDYQSSRDLATQYERIRPRWCLGFDRNRICQ